MCDYTIKTPKYCDWLIYIIFSDKDMQNRRALWEKFEVVTPKNLLEIVSGDFNYIISTE